ncbi:SDR family NAD(P)-dependent oxidoreductase [Pseudonocardia acaciae]|uniref:SDR family NAD(P)-dependent oxidoreductase n=1 Tax=Pseudonocardia acaciae TaxID=551276 RepID=UPI00048C003B|nr:SDR family NAD(P)-dependent oxidoreductase [Pseudonocardia acaciae]
MRLAGRTALVTGASSGIGAATADALAAAGVKLVLLGTDGGRLDAVADRTGGTPLVADLGTESGLRAGCEAAAETDLLVCSAGRGYAGEFAAMPAERVAELATLNLVAPMRMARAALPAMLARGGGHLVFLSSIATVGVRDEAVYAATKAGLRAFAASLRYEIGAGRVGVTTVFPGAVNTPFFDRRGRAYDRGFPRQLEPSAVARALLAAVRRDRPEVFVPRWLTVPARLAGGVPELFHRMAARFG